MAFVVRYCVCRLFQVVEKKIELQEALRDADRLRVDNTTLEDSLSEVILFCG